MEALHVTAADAVNFAPLPLLSGWKVVLVTPLIPMSTAAVYWAAGWPMFLALNMEAASWVVNLVALASVAQAVFIVWICSVALGYSGQVTKSRV